MADWKKIGMSVLVYVIIPGGTARALWQGITLVLRRVKSDPSILAPSSRLKPKIKEWEGKKNVSYQDSVGDWTVGYGHNLTANGALAGQPDISNTSVTDQQAETILDGDIYTAAQAVRNNIKVPLNIDQFDALTDMAFGMGAGAFANSQLVKNINKGNNSAEIAMELKNYDTAGGKELPGLEKRALWRSKLYAII